MPEDPYAALRGMVLSDVDLAPRTVEIGAPISLPRTGPAYLVEPARMEDLRALAEQYAGRPVIEGLPPGYSTELTGFDAGDGWFTSETGSLNSHTYPSAGWGWIDAAWRTETLTNPAPGFLGPCGNPRTAAIEQAVADFFERIGWDVALNPPVGLCPGEITPVKVSVFVDGLPLVEFGGTAMVDGAGKVVEAGGPLLRLTTLGDIELAPSSEVLRRLVQGPGLVPGDCYSECSLDTDGATLGLALGTSGGMGNHDHIPGGVVDDPPSRVLVPALRVPAVGPYQDGETHQGVLAVSSAFLVDDPAQADAAREADATSSDSAEAAAGCSTGDPEPNPVALVCTSQPRPTAGTPILLTAYGERYGPVGASDCQPVFTLDPGDGSGEQSFLPRSGTLITARVAHTYTEAGIYTVVLHGASRCATPASPGGTEPEYDYSARLTVTVTG